MKYKIFKLQMKKRIIIFILPLIFLLQISLSAEDRNSSFVILHVNDTHGNLYPSEKGGISTGGFARIASVIKKTRQENENVLVLYAGDLISRGGPVTVHYGGIINIKAMALMDFDAMTPGNGDFYFGAENLRKLAVTSSFPFIHANVVLRKNNKDTLIPWMIKEINGVRVAILGLGYLNFTHPSISEVEFKDPFKTAGKLVPKLKKKSDICLVLSHLGYYSDKKLAQQYPQIDIIVGGHSHTVILNPLMLTDPENGKKTYIAQAGDYSRYIGRLDVETEMIDGAVKLKDVSGRLVPLDSSVPEDPEVAALLREALNPVNEQIGILKTDYPHPETGNSPLASALIDYIRKDTGTQLSFIDRSSISGGLSAGPVKQEEVYKVHKFRNKVVYVKIKGRLLERVFLMNDIFISGCEIGRTDDNKRIIMIDGERLKTGKKYTVSGLDFLFFKFFRNIKIKETGKTLDNVIGEFIKSVSVE